MVNLIVSNNLVKINKKDNPSYKEFVKIFLTKYENVLQVDRFASTKYKKKFKSVREIRLLYSEDDCYIYFSRGLLEFIPKEYYIPIDESIPQVIQPVVSQEDIKHSLEMFDLRDDQVIAVNKCLIMKRGVIQLPTASGKSAIITSTIKWLIKSNPDIRILVLAPTLSTVSNIQDTLEDNDVDSKMFNKTKSIDKSSVTTSLVQSLIAESKKNPKLLDNVNAVFYDECLPGNAKILLPNYSYKSIKSIYEDDSINEIVSYNVENSCYEVKRILRKFKTPFNSKFWKLYYVNPFTRKLEGLVCTNNHKIYTRDRGYVPLEELNKFTDYIKVDFPLIRNNKTFEKSTYVKIFKIIKNIGADIEYKYNLEVEDNHNYFANNVLVSNCHHLKCDTWNQLNRLLSNVEYSLGFSALSIDKKEIYETDIRNLSYGASLIAGCSGRVLMHIDPNYYIDNHIIATPVVFRINHHLQLPEGFDESNWSQLVKIGLMSTVRSYKIALINKVFEKYSYKTLILVSEKDHAFLLGKFLVDNGVKGFGISFGAGQGYLQDDGGDLIINEVNYVKEESLTVVDKLTNGEIHTIIASSHLDEGVDVKQLDACILACGGKKDRRIIQRVGRVLRKSKTGKFAYIVDFTDTGSNVLHRQSNQRMRMYQTSIGITEDHIYNVIVEEVENVFKRLENIQD